MNKIKIVPPDDIDIEEFIKSIGLYHLIYKVSK